MKEPDVYQNLMEKLDFPQSRYVLRIIEKLLSPEEARILLTLPASAQEIAQKFNMDEVTALEKITLLMKKGLAIPRVRDGETRYFFVRSTLQFHDSSAVYEGIGKEVQDLWRQWRETEVYELCRYWERLPVPIMRVFPYREAIKDEAGILPYEDLWGIAGKARQVAVVKCACRLLLKKCDRPVEVCMTFDAAADFAIKRGVGRKISVEEAKEIYKRCGEAGMVPSNLNGARVTAMCFCCPDCCIFMQPYLNYGYRLLAPSRYQAVVDSQTCSGCQDCVELCQFGAIEMQKESSSKELKASIQPEKCYGCGVCVVNCPTEALALKLIRPPEHIPQEGLRY